MHGSLTTVEATRRQRSGNDIECRLDSDGSGLSPAHCSPCYVSSAVTVSDRSTRRSVQHPDTAAEVKQLSSLVTRQLQKAATSGCGTIVMPTKQVTRMRYYPTRLYINVRSEVDGRASLIYRTASKGKNGEETENKNRVAQKKRSG